VVSKKGLLILSHNKRGEEKETHIKQEKGRKKMTSEGRTRKEWTVDRARPMSLCTDVTVRNYLSVQIQSADYVLFLQYFSYV
jgi:hypothetical protein